MLRAGLRDLSGLDTVAVWWSVMVDSGVSGAVAALEQMRGGGT